MGSAISPEGKVVPGMTHIIRKNRAIPVTLNLCALHTTAGDDRRSGASSGILPKRKIAENKLRKSHETLRALINAAPESLFLLDIDGTVIIANETLARRMGTTVNELVGSNIYQLSP